MHAYKSPNDYLTRMSVLSVCTIVSGEALSMFSKNPHNSSSELFPVLSSSTSGRASTSTFSSSSSELTLLFRFFLFSFFSFLSFLAFFLSFSFFSFLSFFFSFLLPTFAGEPLLFGDSEWPVNQIRCLFEVGSYIPNTQIPETFVSGFWKVRMTCPTVKIRTNFGHHSKRFKVK